MAIEHSLEYQLISLLERLQNVYSDELNDTLVMTLKKNWLESDVKVSTFIEEIRALFPYDKKKLDLFLMKYHVAQKSDLSLLNQRKSFLNQIRNMSDKKFRITMATIATLTILGQGYVCNHIMGDPIGRALTIVPTSTSMMELIQQGVSNNSDLMDEERKFFEQYSAYLEGNPYLSIKDSYYNLKNLQVYYISRSQNKHVLGEYHTQQNYITMYNCNNYDSHQNASTLWHEGMHMFSSNGKDSGFKKFDVWKGKICSLGDSLSEGVTQILVEEYFDQRANGITYTYQEETLLVKFIAELIGADVLLYGYSTHDIDIVVEKLGMLDGDPEKAHRLIELMDQMTAISKMGIRLEKADLLDSYKEQIYSILQEYYKIKVEENAGKASVLTYLLEAFRHIEYTFSPVYCYQFHKAYFSEQLKQQCDPYLKFDDEMYHFDRALKILPDSLQEREIVLENNMFIGMLLEENMKNKM